MYEHSHQPETLVQEMHDAQIDGLEATAFKEYCYAFAALGFALAALVWAW